MKKYNEDITNFFIKNNINVDEIIKKPEAIMKAKIEIDRIVNDNGQYKNEESQNICVGDIIGSIELDSKNIFDNLDELYNKENGKYGKRAIEFLDTKTPLQDMMKSFEKEPILVEEIIKGKYVIAGNGKHRCNLLKACYLNEIAKCSKKEETEKIKEKYTIPVQARNIDVIKTYSKYLLKKISILVQEIDPFSGVTGKSILTDENCNEIKLNDSQLFEFVKSNIVKLDKDKLKSEIPNLYINSEYFKEYIDQNFKDTIIENNIVEWCRYNIKKSKIKIPIIEKGEKNA